MPQSPLKMMDSLQKIQEEETAGSPAKFMQLIRGLIYFQD